MTKMRSKREQRDLVRKAEELGYSVQATAGGHLKFLHPATNQLAFGSSSPSDRRSGMNMLSRLKRQLKHAVFLPEPTRKKSPR